MTTEIDGLAADALRTADIIIGTRLKSDPGLVRAYAREVIGKARRLDARASAEERDLLSDVRLLVRTMSLVTELAELRRRELRVKRASLDEPPAPPRPLAELDASVLAPPSLLELAASELESARRLAVERRALDQALEEPTWVLIEPEVAPRSSRRR